MLGFVLLAHQDEVRGVPGAQQFNARHWTHLDIHAALGEAVEGVGFATDGLLSKWLTVGGDIPGAVSCHSSLFRHGR